MSLAKEMGALTLIAKSDSQLVTGQVAGTFQKKDPQLLRYLKAVNELKEGFEKFVLTHIPCDQNGRADLLSKLASTKKVENHKSVIKEMLRKPSKNSSRSLCRH